MTDPTRIIKDKLLAVLARTEHTISAAKLKVKERFNLLEPILIVPYYGFGNEHYVYLRGRVLEDEKIQNDQDSDSLRVHIRNTYKRYESDEIPGIRLRASFAGQDIEVVTDEEGYFEVEFRAGEGFDYASVGNKVQLKLLEQKTDQDRLEAEGTILVPGEDVEFGIISDIDDTVLVSNVTHFLGQLKLTLTKDATQRSPFPGIAGFMRALCKGSDSQGHNPLFFVSGSEWNLFDLLVNFFQVHGIPEGPLLLRDRGTYYTNGNLAVSEQEYKQKKIRHILDTFPDLHFICIGDSGQHDPEIYQQMVGEYPGRIIGIYIRDVSDEKRDAEVHQIARQLKEQGVEMVLTRDTLEAAKHAAGKGWINEEQLADIEQECEKDSTKGEKS
ncbi:App1 family protein [Telluribacter sp. SYSU D00476]|uniref:App1 family protein n=1 Tax=Telluribacter sp. SYSU D00476 TaxID=2811430 RepID=UPI001FF3CDEC|nr:phosphatase domain-containing protein [Telluribacter sp. SYSU D00476]